MDAVYDPFSPSFQDDPYPAYRRLRDEDPVHRHTDPPFWALSRFEDVWSAVRDEATFSSAQGLTFHPDEIGALGLAPTIVMLDPPRHTRLRALIGKAFTPKRVADLEPLITAFVRERIGRMRAAAADGVPVDLHRDFSSPLPTFVLAHLLGVPATDRHRFDPWVEALVGFQDEGFALTGIADAADSVGEMFEYFTGLIRTRRDDPGSDLTSALCHAEVDGESLTDWDVLGFCFVMVAGGNDTTGNLVSHAVALLDGYPDQRRMLVADPSLVPGALLEFLRLESSVQALARTTTRAVRVRDVEIPAGEKVLMLYGAANRDEREFGPTADVLDVRRDIPRHLGFATGVHFCIGSHLARLQARVALTELLRAFPELGVDLAGAQRLRSAYTRGWRRLPAVNLA